MNGVVERLEEANEIRCVAGRCLDQTCGSAIGDCSESALEDPQFVSLYIDLHEIHVGEAIGIQGAGADVYLDRLAGKRCLPERRPAIELLAVHDRDRQDCVAFLAGERYGLEPYVREARRCDWTRNARIWLESDNRFEQAGQGEGVVAGVRAYVDSSSA